MNSTYADKFGNFILSTSFSSDPITITNGPESFYFEVLFSGDPSKISSGGVHFYSPNAHSRMYFSNIGLADGRMLVPITVGSFAAEGDWFISEINWRNHDGQFNVSYAGALDAQGLDYEIAIKNQNGDDELPVLNDFVIGLVPNIELSQFKLSIKPEFLDEISGLTSVGFQIDSLGGFWVQKYQAFDGNPTRAQAEFLIDIDINDDRFYGEWFVKEVTAYDQAGNFSVYYRDRILGLGYSSTLTISRGTNSGDEIQKSSSQSLIFGLAGDDRLIGSVYSDILIGGSGDDCLLGLDGDDLFRVDIFPGDDVYGEVGNDTIDGGHGEDRAVYSGIKSEYKLTKIRDQTWLISDLIDGRDGVDLLMSVELISFGGELVELQSKSDISAVEIILNEDFSRFEGDGSTEYVYSVGGIEPGKYNLAQTYATADGGVITERGGGQGLMFVVDSYARPDSIIWKSNLDIKSGADYVFSFSATSVSWNKNPVGWGDYAPSILTWAIIDEEKNILLSTIGDAFVIDHTLGEWKEFFVSWSPQVSGKTSLALVSRDANYWGNDFAIDDIKIYAGGQSMELWEGILGYRGGAEFHVDSFDSGYQMHPAGASGVGGVSLIVWQSRSQDEYGWGI